MREAENERTGEQGSGFTREQRKMRKREMELEDKRVGKSENKGRERERDGERDGKIEVDTIFRELMHLALLTTVIKTETKRGDGQKFNVRVSQAKHLRCQIEDTL
jgi:hypothetical protein